MFEVRPFQNGDADALVQLWKDCRLTRDYNDPYRDIRLKLAIQPDLLLVGTVDGRIVASVMAGYEGHRGWLNYLAVAPEWRRQGFGREIVAEAEQRLQLVGCPKINLQVRAANASALEFYRKIGYQVDEVISLGKRLAIEE